MMGYSSQSKFYKLWDTSSSEFIVSRDVTFEEVSRSQVSLSEKFEEFKSENSLIPAESKPSADMCGDTPALDPHFQTPAVTASPPPNPTPIVSPEKSAEQSSDEDLPTTPLPRRSTRVFSRPAEWWNGSTTASSETGHKALITTEEPETYAEATNTDNIDFWREAIQK